MAVVNSSAARVSPAADLTGKRFASCVALLVSGLAPACEHPRTEPANGQESSAPSVSTTPGGPQTSAAALKQSSAADVSIASAAAALVPAGSVAMGGRLISVPAFYMDRTEVTVRKYQACVSSGRCSATPSEGDCNAGQLQSRADHPINCVTQVQARAFCAVRGARLPTQAEWQLAAAGPEGRTYPWGDALPSLLWVTQPKDGAYAPGPARHNLCWQGDGTVSQENYPKSTCPVGSFRAGDTPSGISDLAGNVWEWTSDKLTPPDGEATYVLKGGGFGYDRLGALEVRTTDTGAYEEDFFGPDIGFRCVQEGPSRTR